jgi:hypothetical protein
MTNTSWHARIAALFLAIAALGAAAYARAHGASTAYLRFAPDAAPSTLVADVALRDLHDSLGLDADGDGRVTWAEVQGAEARIVRFVGDGMHVRRGSSPCVATPSPLVLERHAGAVYASVALRLECDGHGAWGIVDTMLFDRDPTHRALLSVERPGRAVEAAVLTPSGRQWRDDESPLARFVEFLRHGVEHIWAGYDHLAFLGLLLLPAVLTVRGARYAPEPRRRDVVLRVLRVVTAFTAAHSLTLVAAALGWWTPPAAPVEVAIAATVVLTALANLRPPLAAHGAGLAFGFGLVHGFGFANALAELGLRGGDVAMPLAGFNVGVELGQLAIVAVVLPLLLQARARTVYARRIVPALSIATAIAGFGWVVQRIAFA